MILTLQQVVTKWFIYTEMTKYFCGYEFSIETSLTASNMVLRLCESYSEERISYESLHTLQRRATPMKMMTYEQTLPLHKLYNLTETNDDWVDLSYQQNFNDWNNIIHILDTSRIRVGKNIWQTVYHWLMKK